MKKKLTKAEIKILEKIISEDKPEYMSHVSTLEITDRNYTICGQYLHFLDSKTGKNDESLTLSSSLIAKIHGLEHGVGFILYINIGKIDCLEMFCYGDDIFPENLEEHHIEEWL